MKYQIVSICFKEPSSFESTNWYLFSLLNNVPADPDGNVIFELNKAEIDDAHKDKQKMFNENFKVCHDCNFYAILF